MHNQPIIEVLDNGFVRLVDSMGDDLSIVRSARVSYNADWRAGAFDSEKSDARLLRYLWTNKHTSPFESVELQFEIKCPFFVARQWHRHRTWSYNEVSARYTELPEDYYIPEHLNAQSGTNKQGRDECHVIQEEVEYLEAMKRHMEGCFNFYHLLSAKGVARELARSVLPMGAYTRFFGKVNLRNLLHFLDLRLDSHAQYEIRVYAEAIKELIKPVIPVTWEIIYGTC